MAFLNEQGLERLWTHIIAKLGNKVDKEGGKGLSTNDYTDEEKNKLASVSGSIESLNTLVGDTNVSTQIGNAINAIDYPVDSVNGKTGAVTLSASDVGALPDTYTIPTASSSAIGGVKVGNGLLINNGSLSVDVVDNLTSASTTKPLSAAQGKALNDAIKSITTDLGDLGAGDMLTATYDKDKDGIVDNAAKLEGYSASYFATASALDELDTLVGDKAVSTQINDAITELDLENTYAPIHTHSYIESNKKGSANGVAELDANGKVPSTQLPSYVDDVLEYSTKSNFPSTGESGKIYVDTSANKTYRWGGSSYVEISASLALGETSSTAYRGDYGKIAYTHSQITDGNPHGITCAKISAVPTSRTVNGKALSANITLSAGDVGADASGAADTALTNAKAYTDAEITEWVGDNTVSAQISAAIANKSDTDHTHIWNEINNKPFISDASDTLTWDGDTNGLLCPNGILYKVSDLVVTLDDLSNGCSIEYAMNDSTVDPIEPIILTSEECQDRYSLDDNWIHLESVICVLVDNSDSLLPESGIYFLNDEISRVKSFTIPGYEGFITEKLNVNALPEHSHVQISNAIANKVDKVSGKDLSTNDYTTTDKDKLAGIAAGAEVNVQSNWEDTDTSSDAYIKNKPAIKGGTARNSVQLNMLLKGSTGQGATGEYSVAEGYETTASGLYSHAEGGYTIASAERSHAEGGGSVASKYTAHAEGDHTTASGLSSHSEGIFTIAAKTAQHVEGRYNIEDTGRHSSSNGNYEYGSYIHIAGNGTSEDARSNAHTLDWNGNAWFSGDVYVGGTNKSTGSKLAKVSEIPAATVIDTTLANSGQAADAKATGDAITNLNTLVGDTKVSTQISNAINGLGSMAFQNIIIHNSTTSLPAVTNGAILIAYDA